MISLKNSYSLEQGPVEDRFAAILHSALAFSVFPQEFCSSNKACGTCPGDGANPTAQDHSLQRLRMMLYREIEELQFFLIKH